MSPPPRYTPRSSRDPGVSRECVVCLRLLTSVFLLAHAEGQVREASSDLQRFANMTIILRLRAPTQLSHVWRPSTRVRIPVAGGSSCMGSSLRFAIHKTERNRTTADIGE